MKLSTRKQLKLAAYWAAFFVLAVAGILWETPPPSRFDPYGQLGGVSILLIVSVLLLWRAFCSPPAVGLNPEEDLKNTPDRAWDRRSVPDRMDPV